MKFEEMNIDELVLKSIKENGIDSPTDIQLKSIPFIKNGFDVIGQSETGSGKTIAFGLPIVEMAENKGFLQALILAPTRELSIQISNELKKLSKYKKLNISTIYGGVPIDNQILELKNADIVVGTPGRVLDHIKRGSMKFENIKFFVLDEADKMIEMGFIEDIKRIERFLPKKRQTLMFSATMPEYLENIRDNFTNNPMKVKTKVKVDDSRLKQYYVDIERENKFSLLVFLINSEMPSKSIIFCESRRDVDAITENLLVNRIKAQKLHGGLNQKMREKVISNFYSNKIQILVATDVAARGLDVKEISHIFNYNIPKNSEDYVNRIGRTARAGKAGKVINLLSKDDHKNMTNIISRYSYSIEKIEKPNFPKLKFLFKSFRNSYTKNPHRFIRR
ncbi:MAG: DEAD/DEAH box helicase [Candidatus Aenigmatarchaeota archaeon]|nr:DEAD/DEAH box helicase [Candidatus Aenigmarchaeota archaeon]